MRAARLLENVLIAMVFILSMVDWGRATPQSNASQTPPGQDRKDLRVLHPRGHAVSRPVRDLPRQDRPPDFDAPALGISAIRVERGGGSARLVLRRPRGAGPKRALHAEVVALRLGAEQRDVRLVRREIDVREDEDSAELRWNGEAFL